MSGEADSKSSPSVAEIRIAADVLANHQQQLDADGAMVGVSREALHIVLSELDRLTALAEEAKTKLDRYRYAIAWAAADSWDFCTDCRERIEWARSLDGARLDVNQVAAIGRSFLSRLEQKG